MGNTEIIPVIDLGPYLAGALGAIDRTAEELHFALTEIGFYFIVNHGVPAEQIHAVFREAARFHALPLQKKLEVKLDKHNVGYLPLRGDTLRTSTVETVTKPNINEAFFVARDLPSNHPEVLADRRFRSANRWPTGLPGFRETVVAYCETMERLVRKLVRLYACALRLPLEYFDRPFKEPQYKLRMTHYPYRTDLAHDDFGIAPHAKRQMDRCACPSRRLCRERRPVAAALDQRLFPRHAPPRLQPLGRRALRAGLLLRLQYRLARGCSTDLRGARQAAKVPYDLLYGVHDPLSAADLQRVRP